MTEDKPIAGAITIDGVYTWGKFKRAIDDFLLDNHLGNDTKIRLIWLESEMGDKETLEIVLVDGRLEIT